MTTDARFINNCLSRGFSKVSTHYRPFSHQSALFFLCAFCLCQIEWYSCTLQQVADRSKNWVVQLLNLNFLNDN